MPFEPIRFDAPTIDVETTNGYIALTSMRSSLRPHSVVPPGYDGARESRAAVLSERSEQCARSEQDAFDLRATRK
jgi:hypothetical protein